MDSTAGPGAVHFFLVGFGGQGGLNKDLAVWVDELYRKNPAKIQLSVKLGFGEPNQLFLKTVVFGHQISAVSFFPFSCVTFLMEFHQ